MDLYKHYLIIYFILHELHGCWAINAEERLTKELLSASSYNRLLRPAKLLEERVNVHFDLLISQLIGVNEREQYMVTKVWLPQTWVDNRLAWNPTLYENITKLQLPSTKIWLPDIVLYNNADGEYEVSLQSNAIVMNTGTVSWMPPAIYRSACNIKVSDFPFDEQNCTMTFRSWTYTRDEIDLHLMHNIATLDDFTPSGEWDIIDTPGRKNDHDGEDAYQDLTYSLIIKRKPLFYTVNLIIPCILITFLAILVFYTPSDCGEKMTLCISVLLALTVFLLLLSKMVPPTSLDVPLIGKYLMFTMVLVTLCIVTSVCVLNVHHRQASTHTMPDWVRKCFLEVLPQFLFMQRPAKPGDEVRHKKGDKWSCLSSLMNIASRNKENVPSPENTDMRRRYFLNKDGEKETTNAEDRNYGINLTDLSGSKYMKGCRKENGKPRISPELRSAMQSVECVTDHLKSRDSAQGVSEDWKFVAMVLDRMFLIIYVFVFVSGTLGIFF